jgi:hypothetical protein
VRRRNFFAVRSEPARNGAAFKTDKTVKIRQSIGNKAESDMPLSPGQGFCGVLMVLSVATYPTLSGLTLKVKVKSETKSDRPN